MLESEAMKKLCPHLCTPAALGMIVISLIPDITADQCASANEELASKKHQLCKASGCMMWDPIMDYEEKTTEAEDPPEGDGWNLNGTRNVNTFGEPLSADNPFGGTPTGTKIMYMWCRHVYSGRGDCGLKSQELQCNAP